jgi:hypothetical protein
MIGSVDLKPVSRNSDAFLPTTPGLARLLRRLSWAGSEAREGGRWELVTPDGQESSPATANHLQTNAAGRAGLARTGHQAS